MECPFPPRSGSAHRNAAVARALSSLGPVMSLGMAGGTGGEAPAGIVGRSLASTGGRKVWKFDRPDHPTEMTLDQAIRQELHACLETFAPDLVVVEGVALLEAAATLADAGARVVLDMHNVESRILAQALENRPLHKRVFLPRGSAAAIGAAERADRRAVEIASQIWACSEEDGKILAGLQSNEKTRTVRNPIPDESALSLEITPERYRHADIAYVGHLSYFPNVEAVKVLLSQVAPLLAQSGTHSSISVIGSGPARAVRRLCRSSGARLVANPSDVVSHLSRAAYAPMPIRHGGGTRLKALEALAAGLVVCATPKAIEGVGLVPDVHYLRCETPAAMAQCIAGLTRAPDRAADIAREGRRFVKERHCFPAIEAQVRSAISELTGS